MDKLTKIKEDSKERGRKFREKNPDYMKNYAKKIKSVFNEKYKETIKNVYERNKDKIKQRAISKKEFLLLCNMII